MLERLWNVWHQRCNAALEITRFPLQKFWRAKKCTNTCKDSMSINFWKYLLTSYIFYACSLLNNLEFFVNAEMTYIDKHVWRSLGKAQKLSTIWRWHVCNVRRVGVLHWRVKIKKIVIESEKIFEVRVLTSKQLLLCMRYDTQQFITHALWIDNFENMYIWPHD